MAEINDTQQASEPNLSKKDMNLRIGYFAKLREHGSFGDNFMIPPPHWLNPNLYTVSPDFEEEDGAPKKVKSIVTILSVWNTMIGSSIVSIPYCTYKAGIIPTLFINLIYGMICYYTCQVVVKTGGKDNDYSDTVHRYFGKRYGYTGRVFQIVFNLSINVGAVFIYFLIINQNLYPCLASLFKVIGFEIDAADLTPSFSRFSIIYCGLLVGICIFPLLIMKQMNLLIKLNSFGIYFVSVLLFYVLYTGINSLTNTSYSFDYKINQNAPNNEPRYLYLFGENPSLLAGTLSLGYFSHSFVLPLMKNNQEQKNNKRDLFMGYSLVFLTYVIVGIVGYIGFSGKYFDSAFKDNWFRFFPPEDIIILILRILNVFQLLTIFPILFFVVRIQFFGTFFGNSYPGRSYIIIFSTFMLFLAMIVLYSCWNILGKLMSIIGAATGLFLIYLIPLVVNIVYYNRKHPISLLIRDKQKLVDGNTEYDAEGNKIEYDPGQSIAVGDLSEGPYTNSEIDIDYHGVSNKPYSKVKNFFFFVSQILLMGYGFFTLIIQFVYINFFGITLQ